MKLVTTGSRYGFLSLDGIQTILRLKDDEIWLRESDGDKVYYETQ